MTTSTSLAAEEARPFAPAISRNEARLLAAWLAIPQGHRAQAVEGLERMASGLCVFSGPGLYRLRERPTSDRTALYLVDEVIEHPDGPFFRCRSADPEAVLPIIVQGPFEAWAINRIDGIRGDDDGRRSGKSRAAGWVDQCEDQVRQPVR